MPGPEFAIDKSPVKYRHIEVKHILSDILKEKENQAGRVAKKSFRLRIDRHKCFMKDKKKKDERRIKEG